MERLLTVQEVADLLALPKATIYAWMAKGVGPRSYRVGRYKRFVEADVRAFLDSNVDERTAMHGS